MSATDPAPGPQGGSRERLHPVALAGFAALSLGVAAAGGAITATSVDTWYAGLVKPAFNPPNWVFGPVWTVLYVMIALAGWRLWRRMHAMPRQARAALAAWLVQLGLNLTWSFVFFGARQLGAALCEIVVLLAAIVATAWLARPVDRVAALLLMPYAAWVAFAMLLNAALWRLN